MTAGCRAIRYEEKIIEEGRKKILVECVKEREREGDAREMEERKKFYRQNGFSTEGVKNCA